MNKVLFSLDTDALTHFQRGHPLVCARCASQPAGSVGIAIISVEEQFLGWYTRARKAKDNKDLAHAYYRFAEFATFVSRLSILPFSEAAMERYEYLLSLRLQVAKPDLRIAAIALEADATLVTRNYRDFQRIPNLKLADWTV